jgi:hypothetical protein
MACKSAAVRPCAFLCFAHFGIFQVVNIIQGSPASQLMGVGESGQRTPLIEISDIIIKVPVSMLCILAFVGDILSQVNSLFVPMQAPDSSINRGPLTLSIRKRSGRTLSVIVERGETLHK